MLIVVLTVLGLTLGFLASYVFGPTFLGIRPPLEVFWNEGLLGKGAFLKEYQGTIILFTGLGGFLGFVLGWFLTQRSDRPGVKTRAVNEES